MSITKTGMGISEATDYKQHHFRIILQKQLYVCKCIFNKASNKAKPIFYYFDLNAGSGLYEENYNNYILQKKGSPIIFLEEVQKAGINFRAYFLDKSQEAIDNLSDIPIVKNLMYDANGQRRIHIKCKEQSYALLDIVKNAPTDLKYGLIYIDPNGIFDDKLLTEIFQHKGFNCIDVLINANIMAIKRCRNVPCIKDKRLLEERLNTINKKYWLYRDTIGSWQWSLILGTNWVDFPTFERIGMYSKKNENGQLIFNKLNYTEKEHLELFKIKPIKITPKKCWATREEYLLSPEYDNVKWERKTNYIGIPYLCEKCQNRMLTEFHHVKYSDWQNGEIDDVTNIIGLCRSCHQQIHNNKKEC